MTQTSLAAAADYSDALLTTRKAKNVLFWVLFVIIIGQMAIFFAVRYSDVFTTAATQPAQLPPWAVFLKYLVNPSAFLGIVFVLVLAADLMLMVLIMIMARSLGVARVTSAFLWCVVLGVMIFPWEAFLYFPGIGDNDFRIPGVLYVWSEVLTDAKFTGNVALKWARFVGFPILALFILMAVHFKSRRGLRQALGENRNENLPNERLL